MVTVMSLLMVLSRFGSGLKCKLIARHIIRYEIDLILPRPFRAK